MPFVSVKNGIIHSIKLEFNLSFHCNFSCSECSHNSPYITPALASLDGFKRDVRALEKVYHVRRFRFEGGEPLLHPKLLSFIEVVRDSRLAEQLHVHTNGSLLHLADEALYREVDILSISWYPDPRCDESKINRARELCARYDTKLRIERIKGFRRINVDESLKPNLAKRVFDSCQIAHSWYCQTFFNGMFYMCSRPLFTGRYRRKKNLECTDFEVLDGLPIHERGLLGRLTNYLACRNPLESCYHCLGSVGRHKTWRSLSAEERYKPKIILRSGEALIDHKRLRYLSSWEHFQRKLLRHIPCLSVARALTMLRDLRYRRSRTLQPRKI